MNPKQFTAKSMLSKIIYSEDVIISEEEKENIVALVEEALDNNAEIRINDQGSFGCIELYVKYKEICVRNFYNRKVTKITMEKQEYIDKFYDMYLKDLALDEATSVTDFMIEHLEKANEIRIDICLESNKPASETNLCYRLVFTYHIYIGNMLSKTYYSKEFTKLK